MQINSRNPLRRRKRRALVAEQLESRKLLATVTSMLFNNDLDLVDPADRPIGEQPTSWSQQRSTLRNISIRFDTAINFPMPEHFELTNISNNETFSLEQDNLEYTPLDAEHVSITFQDGELPDGFYHLEVKPSIHAEFDGDNDGVIGDSFHVRGFHQIEGDFNGDGGVGVQDFAVLAYWFGIADAPEYVDLNGDGGVSIFDFGQFSSQFGVQHANSLPLENKESLVIAGPFLGELQSVTSDEGQVSVFHNEDGSPLGIEFTALSDEGRGINTFEGDGMNGANQVEIIGTFAHDGSTITQQFGVDILVGEAENPGPGGYYMSWLWLNTPTEQVDVGRPLNARRIIEGSDDAYRRNVLVALDREVWDNEGRIVEVEVPSSVSSNFHLRIANWDGVNNDKPGVDSNDFHNLENPTDTEDDPNAVGDPDVIGDADSLIGDVGWHKFAPNSSRFEFFIPCTRVTKVPADGTGDLEEPPEGMQIRVTTADFSQPLPTDAANYVWPVNTYYTELYDSISDPNFDVNPHGMPGGQSPLDVIAFGSKCQSNHPIDTENPSPPPPPEPLVFPISLEEGTLHVSGSVSDDTIVLEKQSGEMVVTLNGIVQQYDFDLVDTIVIESRDGNDSIDIASNIYAGTTIYAGDGDDVITTSSGDSFVDGGSGDDFIRTRGGSDIVSGGTGDDDIATNSGDDFVYGGDGADRLHGGLGDDNLSGGDGDDTLIGSGGDDVIRGDDGDDILNGGHDSDVLIGGDGDDNIIDPSGNNVFIGGSGVDRLGGGTNSGNDLLWGGGTRYDDLNLANQLALGELMSIWDDTSLSISSRKALLEADLLSAEHLESDTHVDRLMGGLDADWYLTSVEDDINEVLEPEDLVSII